MAAAKQKPSKTRSRDPKPPSVFSSEMGFWVGIVTAGAFWAFGERWFEALPNPSLFLSLFFCLFIVMLWLSFRVVWHADCLAVKLGEPYGTLILTLSVISIEVIMIAAVMLTGGRNPTLARDTMFAVLMIVLGGMVGVTLLLGGLRHLEQQHNLRGANAYLTVIITLSILGLVMPRFTTSTADASLSTLLAVFLAVMSLGLYAVFLGIQTMRHSNYFIEPVDTDNPNPTGQHDRQLMASATPDAMSEPDGSPDVVNHSTCCCGSGADQSQEHTSINKPSLRSVGYHFLFLLASMIPIVLLSKKMGVLIDYGISRIGAPPALGGFVVAVLVLSPEGLSALGAAWRNCVQRTINICLGSALATTALTIPAVLVISLLTAKHVELGLDPQDIVLLLLTLLVCVVNFGSGRTNVLQGAVHLILFLTYVVLVFD